MKHLILATAGHVDHGKSALVKALTGSDPDRLPEEKQRGITIDLGFAELRLSGASGEEISLGVIDVPGHEDFVKNMVAGVGSVNVALLVVAADDGWMPQTEEHLRILEYLGVRQGVVALTKADMVTDVPDRIAAARERLRGSTLAEAPIVATSIAEPGSVNALKTVLAEVCSNVDEGLDMGKPRLAVDRAFSLRGVGTVVTGTLTGGRITAGQAVVIQPGGLAARVRSIQSHGRDVTEAGPGRRVALNLPDVPLATEKGQSGVRRGDVVTLEEIGKPGTKLDICLFTHTRGERNGDQAVPHCGMRVRVHHGTGSVEARLRIPRLREPLSAWVIIARLALDSPLFALAGDRVVLRDISGRRTLAGGLVLDAAPPIALGAAQRVLLRKRAESGGTLESMVLTLLERDGAVRAEDLLAQSAFAKARIRAEVERLASGGSIVLRDGLAADLEWWNCMMEKARAAIDAEHRAHPDHAGLSLARLRSALSVHAEIAEMIVNELLRDGFVRAGSEIKRTTHRPALPAAMAASGARIRAALSSSRLEPPSRKELAADPLSAQALKFLIQSGEVAEISAELVMDATAFQQARTRLAGHLRKHGAATAGELREALGTNRRVIVPLLERCDRDGFTRRVGDKRVLREA